MSICTERFIKNYDENSDKGCILEVDIEYPKPLWHRHKDLSFLAERKKKKIDKLDKVDKVDKLVANIEDKEKCVIHISALKQALYHGLILKNVHRVIEFNQEAWLKPYMDMNTKLQTEAKNEFEKDFFKLMKNSVLGKTMENVRNHRDIKLVTTNARRNKLVSEPNDHRTKHFSEDLLATEMNKTDVIMNKPVYLGQAILDISKILMYQFWYYYIKSKYQDKAQLCYMDADSFIIHIETEDFYEDIANDVEKWFDASKYDKNDKRPLPIGINNKVIRKFKDELNGKILKEFCAARAKTYAFLLDDDNEEKKAKGTKKCVIKRMIKFSDYKDAVFKNKIILRSQKIAISSNDDKRIHTFTHMEQIHLWYVKGKC